MQGTSHFPRPGETVAGRYVIDSQLGTGASSRVYAATQTRLDRRVALKVTAIPPEQDTDTYSRWTERFERGARVLSNMTNPYVVDVYDFGETEAGQLYMAMELVEGETLEDRIDAHTLTEDQAARLGIKLLEALDEAHQSGVLHRDIKPANIMLTADGQVRLLDFGVAKPIDSNIEGQQPGLTQENVFVGTPRYAAPEYLLGGDLGPWCDVYSLGLVLWEMVAGEPVVADSGTQGSLRRHMLPEAFSLDPSHVSNPAFHQIIARMLEKDPAKRYRSAADASRALQRFLDGQDIAPRDTPPEGVPSIDPNLDQPSDFFVNAPRSVTASPPLDDASQPSSAREPASAASSARKNIPPRVQQARAEDTPALDTQSTIAEPHDDEPDTPREDGGDAPKSADDSDSVPVPAHVQQMLASGERKADRLHRLKWIALVVLLVFVGGVAGTWFFAPPYWQARLGLDKLRDIGEQSVVDPVRDRVAPEHAEVSATGIFRVVESSGWTPESTRGEMQSDTMSGWTQDYALDETRIRVEVYRLADRPAARARLRAVSEPNLGMRFARRVVVLKPLDEAARPDKLEGLKMMLEEYRDMVDAASEEQ